MDTSALIDGMVLRATLCPQCNEVLPVAVDDEASMEGMVAVHLPDGEHHVTRRGDDIAIWRMLPDGSLDVTIKEGIVLRISKSGLSVS